MSIVGEFVRSMSLQAFQMLGAEELVIGGDSISCILSEVDNGKDFVNGGFDNVRRLQAVCRSSDVPLTILKKIARARDLDFRVESLRKGAEFTTIMLEQVEKS